MSFFPCLQPKFNWPRPGASGGGLYLHLGDIRLEWTVISPGTLGTYEGQVWWPGPPEISATETMSSTQASRTYVYEVQRCVLGCAFGNPRFPYGDIFEFDQQDGSSVTVTDSNGTASGIYNLLDSTGYPDFEYFYRPVAVRGESSPNSVINSRFIDLELCTQTHVAIGASFSYRRANIFGFSPVVEEDNPNTHWAPRVNYPPEHFELFNIVMPSQLFEIKSASNYLPGYSSLGGRPGIKFPFASRASHQAP